MKLGGVINFAVENICSMKTFDDGIIHCMCTAFKDLQGVLYVIAPKEIDRSRMEQWARASGCNIVVVYDIDWNNDLTPWPAAGVAKGAPDFKGLAPQFLRHLEHELMPTVEKALGLHDRPARNLIGISLSGLFALWAWAGTDLFDNVCSISGSLWYEGFVDWLQGADLRGKQGCVLLVLGEQEEKSGNAAFRTVGAATRQALAILQAAGVDAQLQMAPGDHLAPIEPRMQMAIDFLARKA